jgi:predicted nucleic acid-binding protein
MSDNTLLCNAGPVIALAKINHLGLLMIAKKRGLIESVSPLLISARREGYWLSDELLKAVKSLANE